jgi:hypothetical protein
MGSQVYESGSEKTYARTPPMSKIPPTQFANDCQSEAMKFPEGFSTDSRCKNRSLHALNVSADQIDGI